MLPLAWAGGGLDRKRGESAAIDLVDRGPDPGGLTVALFLGLGMGLGLCVTIGLPGTGLGPGEGLCGWYIGCPNPCGIPRACGYMPGTPKPPMGMDPPGIPIGTPCGMDPPGIPIGTPCGTICIFHRTTPPLGCVVIFLLRT